IETRKLRAAEQRAACDIVGVDYLQILDLPDGLVEYGIELRKAIAYEIRSFKPDVVITGSGDLQVSWGLDHADHRAVGLATVDAVRDAGNQWLFTEQFHDGLQPWDTQTILLTGTDPTHFVEVSDSALEKAVASLAAHHEYLADLPDHPAPEDFVPEMLQDVGTAASVPYAMGFAKYIRSRARTNTMRVGLLKFTQADNSLLSTNTGSFHTAKWRSLIKAWCPVSIVEYIT